MNGDTMSSYFDDDKGYIRLIACFLYPKIFVKRKEPPNSLTGLEAQRAVTDHVDNLHQLFDPNSSELGTLKRVVCNDNYM